MALPAHNSPNSARDRPIGAGSGNSSRTPHRRAMRPDSVMRALQWVGQVRVWSPSFARKEIRKGTAVMLGCVLFGTLRRPLTLTGPLFVGGSPLELPRARTLRSGLPRTGLRQVHLSSAGAGILPPGTLLRGAPLASTALRAMLLAGARLRHALRTGGLPGRIWLTGTLLGSLLLAGTWANARLRHTAVAVGRNVWNRARLLKACGHERAHRHAIELRKIEEIERIDEARAPLTLGDERLGTAERLGDLDLPELRRTPCRAEALKKLLISLSTMGSRQSALPALVCR